MVLSVGRGVSGSFILWVFSGFCWDVPQSVHFTGDPPLVAWVVLILFLWCQQTMEFDIVLGGEIPAFSILQYRTFWSPVLPEGDSGEEMGETFSCFLCCTLQNVGLCPSILSVPHQPLNLYYHVGHFAMTKSLPTSPGFFQVNGSIDFLCSWTETNLNI